MHIFVESADIIMYRVAQKSLKISRTFISTATRFLVKKPGTTWQCLPSVNVAGLGWSRPADHIRYLFLYWPPEKPGFLYETYLSLQTLQPLAMHTSSVATSQEFFWDLQTFHILSRLSQRKQDFHKNRKNCKIFTAKYTRKAKIP